MNHLRKKSAPTLVTVLVLLGALAWGCERNESADTDNGEKDESTSAKIDKEAVKKKTAQLETMATRAAEAIEGGDLPKAKRLLEDGLKEADDAGQHHGIQRGRLLLILGNLLREKGDEVASRRNYADAMAIFRVHENQVGRFEVLLAQAQLEEMLGDYAAAQRAMGEAEQLLPHVTELRLKAAFQESTGRLSLKKVRYEEAYTQLLEASRTYAQGKHKNAQADTLLLLATAEDGMGKPKESKRSLEKALKIFRAEQNKAGEVRALHKLAAFAVREKKYRQARSMLEKVHKLYEDLDRPADAIKVERHINSLPEPGKKK